MKTYFDDISKDLAVSITKKYSTSFSSATKLLSPTIRQDIYNIYGFVRLVDEIVDSFHQYDKRELIEDFELQLYHALDFKISLNPVLNAFQQTVHDYQIDIEYIDAFMRSMKADLDIHNYKDVASYEQYIYGSADVVGLMCLKVFVKGDQDSFDALKPYAQKLGSAFQKVNFLRDLQQDYENLGRSYFPNTSVEQLSETDKQRLIDEIRADFNQAYIGIKQLPLEARLGVYVAYKYYLKLLEKIAATPAEKITHSRIRVPNAVKFMLLGKSYLDYQLKLIQ
jgi:phytoene/squalene synthetase